MRIEAGERALVHAHRTGGRNSASQDLEDKAVTFLRHLENREWAEARAMCSEEATVWHNDGKGDQTIEENIAGMAAQIEPIESMHYNITRQFSQPDEVLQQHAVHVVTKDATLVRVDAAVYFRFDDGLITRIEEYASSPTANDA
jgi:ketosteroid isomerase-like protein